MKKQLVRVQIGDRIRYLRMDRVDVDELDRMTIPYRTFTPNGIRTESTINEASLDEQELKICKIAYGIQMGEEERKERSDLNQSEKWMDLCETAINLIHALRNSAVSSGLTHT